MILGGWHYCQSQVYSGYLTQLWKMISSILQFIVIELNEPCSIAMLDNQRVFVVSCWFYGHPSCFHADMFRASELGQCHSRFISLNTQ